MVTQAKIRPSNSEGIVARETKPVDESKYSGRLAARIRALRIEAGMDVKTLAAAVTRKGYKLGTSTLYAWENGNLQAQLDALPALAKALKVSLLDLLPSS